MFDKESPRDVQVCRNTVIPAKAGIQTNDWKPVSLDSRLRGSDEKNELAHLVKESQDRLQCLDWSYLASAASIHVISGDVIVVGFVIVFRDGIVKELRGIIVFCTASGLLGGFR